MRFFRKPWLGLLWLCFGLATTPLFAQTPPFSYTSDVRDTLGRMREDEERRLMDPALGRVPYERLAEEREKLIKAQKLGTLPTQAAIPGITWQERGPSNAGGLTRALLFDPNDPAKKKVWAASPVGGLWHTNDITDVNAGWTPVSDAWENTVVTALAADPSAPQVMYASTGSSSGVGGGIWKTSDGGATWNRLSSTIPSGSYPSVGRAFQVVESLVVNTSGQVFAGTLYGVLKSSDGGSSWQFALAPNQGIGFGTSTGSYWLDAVTDLKIGTDGILYAAFNTGRLFRSTTAGGTSWAEITPTTGGERTVLALAPSTSGSSQIVYAVSRKPNNANYTNDVVWFKKSTNGGTSWTDVTIPGLSWGSYHFTNGTGYQSMNLTVHPTDATIVYAGGYGLFRTTNGGTTWTNELSSLYEYTRGLWLQPGGFGAAIATDNGVRWASDWTINTTTNPSIASRNNGYRIGNVSSVSMRAAPGSSYILCAGEKVTPTTLQGAGLQPGTLLWTGAGASEDRTFIDENEPAIQVFSYNNQWYTLTGTTAQWLFSLAGWYNGNMAAYDSQNNVLYTGEWFSSTNINTIRRTTGVGGSVASTNFTISGFPQTMRLGKNPNTLFVGIANGLLVRFTNLNQTTPTATTISTSGFPTYGSISSIDVGATDSELLVTFSNYGVASVWYTNDGGVSWMNKDPAGSGLPDVPVYAGMFNPQNRQQVLLGTELGVWTTNDITLANPGWGGSNTGFPLRRVNRFQYRTSDGKLLAATGGRGIFESNSLAIPYPPSSISLTGISNTTLCAGNPLSVSFTTSGPISSSSTIYEIWVSDANGNFTNQRKLGSGTSSPVSVTLPVGSNAVPYGAGYKVLVVAPDYDISSGASSSLTIGRPFSALVSDRRGLSNSFGFICSGDQISLRVAPSAINVPVDSYQWMRDGNPISNATSQTYLAGQSGYYQATLRQAGCNVQSEGYTIAIPTGYSTNVITKFGQLPQCDDAPVTLTADYRGEASTVQWVRNGIDIAGATSSTLLTSQSGGYSIRLLNSLCPTYPNTVPIQIGRSLYASLTSGLATSQVTICSGSSDPIPLYSNFSSMGISTDGYTITWFRDNVPTNQSQNQSVHYVNQPGSYTFELRQGSCVTRSNAVLVETSATIPQLKVDWFPANNVACTGDTRTIYATDYLGKGTFQWIKDGVDIPNATNSTYTVNASGAYAVRYTTATCSAMSLPVSFTFTDAFKPVIFGGGESCGNVWLQADINTQQLSASYQWFKNGVAIAGATSVNYNVNQFGQTGLYSVSVTAGNCTGISSQVWAKPYVDNKLVIESLRSTNVCNGNAVYFRVSSGISAQWKRNGIALTGIVANYYYPTQPGFYTAQSTACGGLESDPVEVRIGEPTAATIAGNALIGSGQTATLPIQLSGPAPWSFTLSNGQTVQNTYLNPYPFSVTAVGPATGVTAYSVVAVQNACGTGTTTGQSSVTVAVGSADLSLTSAVSTRTPRVGDIVSYSLTLTNNGPFDAYAVQLTNRLPAGLEFVDSPSSNVSASNGVVTTQVPSFFLYSTTTISYRLRVTQPGTFFNATQVAYTVTPDPDSQPNSGTGDGQDDQTVIDLRTADAVGGLVASANPDQVPLPTTQSNQPTPQAGKVELSLEMRSSVLSIPAGQPQNLSVVVSNRGAVAATNVEIRVLLPTGWSLTNSTGFLVDEQTVRGYVNQLTAGTSSVLVLPVQGNATGVVQAQIQAVNEPVSNASPGNGFTNGERDEASLQLRVR